MSYRGVGHVIFSLHLGVGHVFFNHHISKCSGPPPPPPRYLLTSPLFVRYVLFKAFYTMTCLYCSSFAIKRSRQSDGRSNP